ncbi:MAG: hypothetical protein OXK80_01415 [Bdellovibrionales bacterium]|nr:hypothetical protein [Bdellovibrionales bacterium]
MRLIYALLLLISCPAVSDPAHTGTVTVSTQLGGTVEVSTRGVNTPLRPDSNTVVHKMLEHGANKQSLQRMPAIDVTAQNKKSQSVFLFGVIYSDLETLQFLNELDSSAVYLPDQHNRSPLLIGLKHKKPLAMIQFIYNLHPEAVSTPDNYGRLALHYAFRYTSDWEVIRFILQMHPSAAFIPDNNGRSPLLIGLRNRRPLKMIKFIYDLHYKAVSTPDNHGNLALHYALKYTNDWEVIQFIFKMNPSAIFIRNNDGKTPIDIGKKHIKGFTTPQLWSSRPRKNSNRNRCQKALSLR